MHSQVYQKIDDDDDDNGITDLDEDGFLLELIESIPLIPILSFEEMNFYPDYKSQ